MCFFICVVVVGLEKKIRRLCYISRHSLFMAFYADIQFAYLLSCKLILLNSVFKEDFIVFLKALFSIFLV